MQLFFHLLSMLTSSDINACLVVQGPQNINALHQTARKIDFWFLNIEEIPNWKWKY